MSDFGSYEYAVGSVMGLRAFRVDELGRLTGCTHKTVWTPGENVATCRRKGPSLDPDVIAILKALDKDVPDSDAPNPCAGLDPACACGFYAFLGNSSQYSDASTVTGVIEGYGKTVFGTKGFRCEKARIVGLTLPIKTPPTTEAQPPSRSELARGGYVSSGNPWLSTLSIRYFRDAFASADLSQSLRTKVLRNYDGIPFYATVDELLEAHPIERPVEPTPQSDPHFWTRSVA